MIVILVFAAAIIVLSTFCISLFVDRRRWRSDYERDIKICSIRHSSELQKKDDEISRLSHENAQLKDRIETLEIQISGYRALVAGVHDDLSESVKMDHRSLIQCIREQKIRLMLFAKHDDSLSGASVCDHRKTEFIGRLMAEYPIVTETSAYLAYLIATNTSVPTICKVLNINAKSVQMARFRLRKKLGLQQNDSLEDSLQQFFNP